MTTPKYRTDARACSCPGFWHRRTCKHYRAYREAVKLVRDQDAFNAAFPQEAPGRRVGTRFLPSPIPANLAGMGKTDTRIVCAYR